MFAEHQHVHGFVLGIVKEYEEETNKKLTFKKLTEGDLQLVVNASIDSKTIDRPFVGGEEVRQETNISQCFYQRKVNEPFSNKTCSSGPHIAKRHSKLGECL